MREVEATRREFLRSAAQAGAVLALPAIVPAAVLGKNGAVPPSEKIVVGGIGIQGRGMSDLQWIMGEPDVQFVAICDLQKKQRLAVKNVRGQPATATRTARCTRRSAASWPSGRTSTPC